MSGKTPDCVACGFVTVIPENYEIVTVLFDYMNYMVDGMKSLSLNGVCKTLEIAGLPVNDVNLKKITTFLVSFMLSKNKEAQQR